MAHPCEPNPVEVIIAATERGREIVGVIDGATPVGVETSADVDWRRAMLPHGQCSGRWMVTPRAWRASLVEQFTFVILLATLTTLIPYVFSAAAQLLLLVTDRARFEIKRLAGHVTIALLALAYAIWTVAGSGYEVVYKGFMLLQLGIPAFLWMKYAAYRHGTHVVATGVAESVAAHGDQLHLPVDLDAALAAVIADEQRVVVSTPIDLGRLVDLGHPVRRVTYVLKETSTPNLAEE